MGARHLYEMLREDQEPFALQSFIRERRRQLQPLACGLSSPSPTASSLLRSQSASLAQLRSRSVKRRSLLSCLALSKSPFSSAGFSAALFTLRTVSRSRRDDDPHQYRQQRRRRKRRKSGAKGDDGSVNGGVRSGIVDFLAKRLFARKRNLVGGFAGASPKDTGGSCKDAIAEDAAKGSEEEADSVPGQAGDRELSPITCRCGIPECPLYDGGVGPPPAIATAAEEGERTAVLNSSAADGDPGSPATPGPSAPEPGGSPELFCGGDEAPLEREEKQQLSPVSVLDLPFYEEEDGRRRGEGDEDGTAPEEEEEEEDDDDDEPFHHRLAALERTKRQLLLKISSFERLAANLEPVALHCRLDEEGDDSPDQDGAGGLAPPASAEEESEDGAGARRRMRRKVEAWKGAGSEVARKMVETDQRREGDAWRWLPEIVPELAAEVSAAVFAGLVNDLAVEFCSR